MKRPMIVPVVVGVLLLGACDNFFASDPDDVFLRIDRTEYAPGDTVQLRLVNEAGEPIGHNLCDHDIQQDVDGAWTETDYHHGEPCPAQTRTLANGESTTFETPLQTDMAPGTYRFRTTFRLDDDEHPVASRSFDVE